MNVIADSAALSYMIDAGAIQYLQDYYQQMLITPRTLDELKRPEQSEQVREWANNVPSRDQTPASWVQVVQPKDKNWMQSLPDVVASKILHLNDERCEMVAAALENKADTFLSDNRDAREYIGILKDRGLTNSHPVSLLVSMGLLRGDGYDSNASTLAKLGNRMSLSLPFLKHRADLLAHQVDKERHRIDQQRAREEQVQAESNQQDHSQNQER